jgi:ribosome-associated heat shock protein Hsp15
VTVRVDKWLQVARVFKTRTQATRACTLGRVRVNGATVKPHRSLALEDVVEVRFGDWTRVVVVKELRDRPLPKADAARVLEDRSPPRPERRREDAVFRPAPVAREPGSGRPTKRQRRQLDRLKGR